MELKLGYFVVYVINWLFRRFLNMFWRSSRKPNLPSRSTPKCFWNFTCLPELLLKFSGGCDVFFILREKITFFCWDQGWKSFLIDLPKHLFCLIQYSNYLLTNLYCWLQKKVKHRLQKALHLLWDRLKDRLYRLKTTMGQG